MNAISPNRNNKGVDVTQNLSFQIIALASALGRSASAVIPQEVGISVAQWRVVSVIGSRKEISSGDLVRILEIDKGWISRTLAKLQEDGVVIATPDPMDKRQFSLSLTESGMALHVKGSRISRLRQRNLIAEFNTEEYQTLKKLLNRLYKATERMG